MKNTIKFLAFALLIFTLNACDDEQKPLADVEFETTITKEIPFHFNIFQDYTSETVTIGLDNEDTNPYLNELKSVTIKSLKYKFVNFSGDSDCSMNVEISTDNTIFEIKEFEIHNATIDQTVFEITDIDKLSIMANLLKENKEAIFKMEGAIGPNGNEADFTVQVTLVLEIVANPL